MAHVRAGIPASFLALILLSSVAGAQATNPLDIFKNRGRPAPVDSTAGRVTHVAPPPSTELGLPVRPLRVPGALASLGDSVRTVLSGLGVWATAQPGEGGQLYSATVTYFGESARAKLRFLDGRLAQAEFELDQPDPDWVRFVTDELRRQGYRRACRTLDDQESDCTWTGRTEVWMHADATRLSTRVGVPPERRAPPADSATVAAAAPTVLPETLFDARPTRGGRPAPLIDKLATPVFPASARSAGVQGVVHVVALVDEAGNVTAESVLNSIRELDAAALETASRYRFKPYRENDRAVRFRIVIPVRFLLY
jgi:TonB family protein